MEEVQRLGNKVLEYLDLLDASRSNKRTVSEGASADSFDAIDAVYQAREYYWDLSNPEQ